MDLSDHEFRLLRQYIFDICGISLKKDKAYLIRHRLEPLVKAAGLSGFLEYYKKLKACEIPNGKNEVIIAITTNETAFFRDKPIFDAFRFHVLPELAATVKQRRISHPLGKKTGVRIWSAGSSYGQEPYSIAMLIAEYLALKRLPGISPDDFSILATDISARVLHKAVSGEYDASDLAKGLPAHFREKYFRRTEEGKWVLVPDIRRMVKFRGFNLMEPFTMLGTFDVIFCRNVLYYFDQDTRSAIIEQFHRVLPIGGKLFLGATENIYPLAGKFRSVGEGGMKFYLKK